LRKLITIIGAFALFVGWYGPHLYGIGGDGFTPENKWVGWANSSGTPTGAPTSSAGLDQDFVVTDQWTASEDGTIKNVNAYLSSTEDNWQAAYLVVYNGTTLVGKSSSLGSISSTGWQGDTTITVEGGQSLDFSTSDTLYFGIGWDNDAAGTTRYYRENAGGDGAWYEDDDSFETPTDVTGWELSSSRDVGFILNYETR
jgi:hypothetical protein